MNELNYRDFAFFLESIRHGDFNLINLSRLIYICPVISMGLLIASFFGSFSIGQSFHDWLLPLLIPDGSVSTIFFVLAFLFFIRKVSFHLQRTVLLTAFICLPKMCFDFAVVFLIYTKICISTLNYYLFLLIYFLFALSILLSAIVRFLVRAKKGIYRDSNHLGQGKGTAIPLFGSSIIGAAVALGFIIPRFANNTVTLITIWVALLIMTLLLDYLVAPSSFSFLYCQLRFPEFRLTPEQQIIIDAKDKKAEQAHLNWEKERDKMKREAKKKKS
ncbi:MAG: hypothetical protein ACE3JK_03650 [Sporolactobacillus sp.]